MSQLHRGVRRLLLSAGLAAMGLGLVAPPQARAGFTILLANTTPSGGNTTFNFTASIAPDDSIVSGNFFRIYDFNGLTGTPTAPAGWTVSEANSNPTPPPAVLLEHGDDPAIPNLTFTYTGATITGPTTISGFSADSIFGQSSTIKDFVGQDTKAATGSLVDSRGDIAVPGPAVPEPSGLITMSLGTILFGAAFAWRNRRKTAV
jgi:hypothetical protein